MRATAVGAVAPVLTAGTAAEAAVNRWGPAVQPVNLAARLTTLPPQTTQVIVVHGPDYATTTATLQTYERVGGVWRFVNPGVSARIGAEGFTDHPAEGLAATPTGVYAIGATMYGIAADPGVRHAYHRVVVDDWWNENPESAAYNTFQHSTVSPGGYSEALWRYDPQYTHFAVITYNMPPTVAAPVPYAGSGIFLHQHSTGAGPTAGCVSLAHEPLVGVLRWLDPGASPRIVLSPVRNLGRY
ncbi:hypothetical protein GCM10027605_49490 [Micromonospora zhanjiangensis]